MDMKKILQVIDGAVKRPVVDSSDMKRFVSIVAENNVAETAKLSAQEKLLRGLKRGGYDAEERQKYWKEKSAELKRQRDEYEKDLENKKQGVAEDGDVFYSAGETANKKPVGKGTTVKNKITGIVGKAYSWSVVKGVPYLYVKGDDDRYQSPAKDWLVLDEQGVSEGSLEEYGDTAKGQKMLTKVQKRAVDRVTSKKADTDPAYAKKNKETADRAWERFGEKEKYGEGLSFRDYLNLAEAKKKITASEDPCWKGYKMVGTKKKGGREVPNCVPGKKGD
jgi:hypothetical protein